LPARVPQLLQNVAPSRILEPQEVQKAIRERLRERTFRIAKGRPRGRRTTGRYPTDGYVWLKRLVSLEKIVLRFPAAGGKVAATATVIKPAINAYSTKSWPRRSFQIRWYRIAPILLSMAL
jgi:hypothetical protein